MKIAEGRHQNPGASARESNACAQQAIKRPEQERDTELANRPEDVD
jgi:hypothetical protein